MIIVMYPQHQIQIAMLHFLTALVLYKVLFHRPRYVIHPSYSYEQWTQRQPELQITPSSNINATSSSTAVPLFYHVSPGSTGSRTLYHASCSAGYPSVHHKSFCISNTRGIENVNERVVDGVRAHFEVLRLYEMAASCTSLHQKGKLDPDREEASEAILSLCYTTVNEWAANLTMHLKHVIQSDLVGLFDTPYPYLAPQVLEYTKLYRQNTVIGMTERDPSSWAKSRIKHGLLLCRKEYSIIGKDTTSTLGSSEFDALGCISRASLPFKRQNQQQSNRRAMNNQEPKLHFWDVFRYRSHHERDEDYDFLRGMEQQMTRHQQLYLPLAPYTPDFFGVHTTNDKSLHRIDEKEVSKDISRLLSKDDRKATTGNTMPLKCRGRVNWEMSNDTFVELYHLPKTCEANAKEIPIPLI